MNTTIKFCRKNGFVTIYLEEEYIYEVLMTKILVLDHSKKELQSTRQSKDQLLTL